MKLEDFLDTLVSRIEVLENQYLQVSERCDRLETRVKTLALPLRVRHQARRRVPRRPLDTDSDPLS